MPILYPSGGSRHIPYPFFFRFAISLVSEVARVIKNLTLSLGSNLGPTGGGYRALHNPSLGSPCTLLRLQHTGAREVNVMLRATSPKVLQFSSRAPKILCFSRAFSVSTPWDLHTAGRPPHVHFVHLSWKKVPCGHLCIGNSPGFRKQRMPISVTALVLSGFHPHQSVVLYICSVPFLPPELAWERKRRAEWMCSLDWNSKQHNFPSTQAFSD